MQIPRWRNVLFLKNSLKISTSVPSSTTAAATSIHCVASFHSTPTSHEKWKNKWNADEDPIWKFDGNNGGDAESDTKGRSKSYARHFGKSYSNRKKRKFRRESFSEDFDDPETIFQGRFGNRRYTWTYQSWEESSFQSSAFGFDWREHSNRADRRTKDWKNSSEVEYDDELCSVGSSSDRTILGLPPRGPLKLDDVKNAFRLSALKWHPDKHQGSSQAMAEEKFKLCLNAYKSLCAALS